MLILRVFLIHVERCFIFSSTNRISNLALVILLLTKYFILVLYHSRVFVNRFMDTIIMLLYYFNSLCGCIDCYEGTIEFRWICDGLW